MSYITLIPHTVTAQNGGGFNRAVVTSLYNMKKLGNEVNETGFWDTLSNMFSSPENAISKILIFPFQIAYRVAEGDSPVSVEYIEVGSYQTDIVGHYLEKDNFIQMRKVCVFEYSRYFNDYRDFDGYSEITLQLPLLGSVKINCNDLVYLYKSVNVPVYIHIYLSYDVYSGLGTYYILGAYTNELEINEKYEVESYCIPLGEYNVQVAIECPIGATNQHEIQRNAIMGAVKTVAGLYAGMPTITFSGASQLAQSFSPSSAPQIQSVSSKAGLIPYSGKNIQPYRQIADTTPKIDLPNYTSNEKSMSMEIRANINDTAKNSLQLGIRKATGDERQYSNNNRYLSKYPILYKKLPKSVDISETEYAKLVGFPLQEVRVLGELRGYTEIGDIHIDGISNITKNEYFLLENALTNGIIL